MYLKQHNYSYVRIAQLTEYVSRLTKLGQTDSCKSEITTQYGQYLQTHQPLEKFISVLPGIVANFCREDFRFSVFKVGLKTHAFHLIESFSGSGQHAL